MKKFFLIIKFFLKNQFFYLLTSALITIILQDNLSFSKMIPIINSIQLTAGAIFTISGIWIAYLYPQTIVALQEDKISAHINKKNGRTLEALVLTIISCLGILGFSIFLLLINELIKLPNPSHQEHFDNVLLGLIFYLSSVIFQVVIKVINSNIDMMIDLRRKIHERDAHDHL